MFLRNKASADDERFVPYTGQRTRSSAYHSRPSLFDNRNASPVFLFGFVVVIIAVTIGVVSVSQMTSVGAAENCIVTDKDRTTNADGVSDMRIYTENCDVLQVGDNLLVGQFDSASVYASIKVGSTYNFETRGSRLPILSMFPNIVGVTEVAR